MSGAPGAAGTLPLRSGEAVPAELQAAAGGKAGPLLALAARGHPVWPGVVLLPPADGPLTAAALAELQRALAALPGGAGPLAVRSSAAVEDGSQCSYAGQFHTRLHVPPEALAEAIEAVWASTRQQGVAAYGTLLAQARQGEAGDRRDTAASGEAAAAPAERPAVLVQPMLPALVAGVAFGADPVSGHRGLTLIQAVAGLADDLLAGRCDGDRYRLDRDGTLLERQLLTADGPLLQDEELLQLHRLVQGLARELGGPQDVEWALDGQRRLWLLQARPITTLQGLADPAGAPGLWDNSNIVESYPGVTTPLTFSFARKAYSEVYASFCRFMGVPAPLIRRHRAVFATMIGFHQGRIYYNLLSWYRVLSLLPGYGLNAGFLERMLGVQQPLSPEQRRSLRLEPRVARLTDLLRLGSTLAALLLNACTLEQRRRDFRRRLDRSLLDPAGLARLGSARPDELVGQYRRIEADLLSHWDAPLINDFYAMVLYGLLGGLLRRWRLDPDGGLLQRWISELGAVISTEPHRRIRAMAQGLRGDPELVALLAEGSLAEIRPALAQRPAVAAELSAYLETFGDRCLGELKLETLSLRDDPLPLLRSLAAAAAPRPQARPGGEAAAAGLPESAAGRPEVPPEAPKGSSAGAPGTARRPARGRAGRPTGSLPRSLSPGRRLLLGWLRRGLRSLLTQRENLRFERTRVFGQARRLLLELGQRCSELGLLDRAEDALFLEVEELLATVEGTATSGDLRALAELRRRQWQQHLLAPPLPRRFRTRGIPGLDLPRPGDLPAPGGLDPQPGEPWQGLGCSPGRVRGPVQLVHDPRRWLEQRPGLSGPRPILVATATDPGWVLLFPHAAGLLVERGSALSHVAIVAREVGLPMVSELVDISQALRDGDRVDLDGASGRVWRLEAEAEAEGEDEAEIAAAGPAGRQAPGCAAAEGPDHRDGR
ncbi:MAG: PEP/pyruvate-binding domain-containing protein [Synechococcaceae cyanobacterium]|nr:PEP/pyruvate-binding domain-containing protein [Synechococcaceae cyanobacterium]